MSRLIWSLHTLFHSSEEVCSKRNSNQGAHGILSRFLHSAETVCIERLMRFQFNFYNFLTIQSKMLYKVGCLATYVSELCNTLFIKMTLWGILRCMFVYFFILHILKNSYLVNLIKRCTFLYRYIIISLICTYFI
jgi:hypothetical protein